MFGNTTYALQVRGEQNTLQAPVSDAHVWKTHESPAHGQQRPVGISGCKQHGCLSQLCSAQIPSNHLDPQGTSSKAPCHPAELPSKPAAVGFAVSQDENPKSVLSAPEDDRHSKGLGRRGQLRAEHRGRPERHAAHRPQARQRRVPQQRGQDGRHAACIGLGLGLGCCGCCLVLHASVTAGHPDSVGAARRDGCLDAPGGAPIRIREPRTRRRRCKDSPG